MSKPDFGWSYPPGAASDPLAPYNQQDPPCECGCDPASCNCPECPICGTAGQASVCMNTCWPELVSRYSELCGQLHDTEEAIDAAHGRRIPPNDKATVTLRFEDWEKIRAAIVG